MVVWSYFLRKFLHLIPVFPAQVRTISTCRNNIDRRKKTCPEMLKMLNWKKALNRPKYHNAGFGRSNSEVKLLSDDCFRC